MRWIAFALLAACGGTHVVPDGGTSPDLAPSGPLSSALLVLGGVGANSEWVDLTDGQDVTLVEGAQGGFHVWLKWRVSEMTDGTVTMQRTARRAEDGQLVLRTSGSVMVGPNGASQPYESPDPMPMFMCPSPIGLSVIDRPIVFRVELVGFVAKEITLVPHCPGDPTENAFCMKICTG